MSVLGMSVPGRGPTEIHQPKPLILDVWHPQHGPRRLQVWGGLLGLDRQHEGQPVLARLLPEGKMRAALGMHAEQTEQNHASTSAPMLLNSAALYLRS